MKNNLKNIFNKAVRGIALSPEEKSQIVNLGVDSFLLPEEVKEAVIKSNIRYKRMKDLVEVIPVKTKEGTYFEGDDSNVTVLNVISPDVPIVETSQEDKKTKWKLTRYASFCEIEGDLYKDANYDLTKIVEGYHGKQTTKTENQLIFSALTNGMVPTALPDSSALLNAMDTEVNPSLQEDAIIVTNQDGFKKLRSLPDYQVIKTDQGVKRFIDIYPLEVFSNTDLASINGKAPVFFGSFGQAVKLFSKNDLEVKTSMHQKFLLFQEVLKMRFIESFDVKLHDASKYKYKLL